MRLRLCVIYFILGCVVSNCQATANDRNERQTNRTPLCISLNEFISCFQFTNVIGFQDHQNQIELKLNAFGSSIDLVLFSSNLNENSVSHHLSVTVVENDGSKSETYNLKDYYRGHIRDQTYGTSAHGRFNGYLFDGVVKTKQNVFYFEPASKYFNATMSAETMIVYRENDVKFLRYEHQHAHKDRDRVLKTRIPSIYNSALPPNKPSVIRDRRSSGSLYERKTCELHAVVDHTYLTHEARNDIDTAIADVVYHVTESDHIFRNTDFDGDAMEDNVGFTLTNITIYENVNVMNYYMSSVGDTVDEVLDQFSRYNFDHACLAILFTHRDYDDGVIGLAWMASSNHYDYPGGICQERVQYATGTFSFNTLLVSSLNYGNVIPKRVTSLTVTHELGHAFGASHDPTSSSFCAPGGAAGHYIMHPYSSDADKRNNDKFSPCSKMYIAPVIENKGSCLRITQGMVCGNEIVEPGEECDCGYSFRCDVVDHCCTPATYESSDGCILRNDSGVVCSPAVSECCNSNCTLKSSLEVCKEQTECASEVYCTGTSTECPQPEFAADNTPCQFGQSVCRSGECSLSLCDIHGYTECQCMSDPANMCKFCCQTGTTQDTCVPASDLDILDQNGEVLFLRPSQSCYNYTGHCDQNQTCVYASTIRILEKLDDLLKESPFNQIVIIVRNYWYFVLIAALSSLLFGVAIRTVIKDSDPQRIQTEQRDHLARLQLKAETEYSFLTAQLAKLNSQETDLVENEQGMDGVVAVGRLCTFFPSVSRTEIVNAVTTCANEEAAVTFLLHKGYALRQLFEGFEYHKSKLIHSHNGKDFVDVNNNSRFSFK